MNTTTTDRIPVKHQCQRCHPYVALRCDKAAGHKDSHSSAVDRGIRW